MHQFNARREPIRFVPAIATLALTVCAGALITGSRAEAGPAAKGKAAVAAKAQADSKSKSKAKGSTGKPEAVTVAAKADKAGSKTPGYGKPQSIKVKLRKGETLEAAVRRAEASAEEAKAAAKLVQATLGRAPEAGQVFQIEVAPREGRVGSGQVHKLTLKPDADSEPLVLQRSKAGKLVADKFIASKLAQAKGADAKLAGTKAAQSKDKTKLAKAEGKTLKTATLLADAKDKGAKDRGPKDKGAKIKAEVASAARSGERVKLVSGEVRGSLYGSARKAGVGGGQIGEIVKVFAAKLDFERDLKAGDKFKVVYDDDGKLLFAQIKGVRFHRFAREGGETMWLDEDGRSLKGGLLRTPVDGARMSSLFGMRRHPILGYAKMHQGIDFAAASGTPIMAAGDGTVVEIRRWGGYGNWLRIRHAGGYESGYAHLSRYASGLSVGDKVRQGQLVAYVGSTGASTGPHLHHEIWLNGKRVDPKGARIPAAQMLEGKELVAFKAQRQRVDAALEGGRDLAAKKNKSKVAALRPKQDAA